MSSAQEIIGCLLDEDVFSDTRLPTLIELFDAWSSGTLSEGVDRCALIGTILESSRSPLAAIKQMGEKILRHLQETDPTPEQAAWSQQMAEQLSQRAGGPMGLVKQALSEFGGRWTSRIWNFVGGLFGKKPIGESPDSWGSFNPARGSKRPGTSRYGDTVRGSRQYEEDEEIRSADRLYWQQQERIGGKGLLLLGLLGLILMALSPVAAPFGFTGIALVCGTLFRAMTKR